MKRTVALTILVLLSITTTAPLRRPDCASFANRNPSYPDVRHTHKEGYTTLTAPADLLIGSAIRSFRQG